MDHDGGFVAAGSRGPASGDRATRADLWKAGADEQERLADERERLADEREALADERDRLADRHEGELDGREAGRQAPAGGGEPEDVAQAQAAVRRAEAALERAQAQLVRARQAAVRVAESATRRCAGADRDLAVGSLDGTTEPEESAWLADRRDFVAAEREQLAGVRADAADERDEVADLRERVSDWRDRESLDRQRRLDHGRRTETPAGVGRFPETDDDALHARLRAKGEHQRRVATDRRRTALRERARALAEWGPHPYGPMLLASFADLAEHLFGVDDLDRVLTDVLAFTVDAVDGCIRAAVTLVRDGRVTDAVSSDAVAAELDDAQFRASAGPALDALHGGAPVHVTDLPGAARWPGLAAAAARHGMASSLHHRLAVRGPAADQPPLGVFSLYSAAPDGFGDAGREFATILAAYLSVTVATAHRRHEVDRREAALHRGLGTRDVIGQAKGILMERQHLSAGDAFDVLRRASQGLNRKLADVAWHLTETGDLPE